MEYQRIIRSLDALLSVGASKRDLVLEGEVSHPLKPQIYVQAKERSLQ
jgi:hypothetical protein